MTLDISKTLDPRSDQLNADNLLRGPMVVTIVGGKMTGAKEQPVELAVTTASGEKLQPYKPCLTMRRLLCQAWADTGGDGSKMVGRSLGLYRDASISFGKEKGCGGIRISSMSHLPEATMSFNLTESKGHKRMWHVTRIEVAAKKPAGTPWERFIAAVPAIGLDGQKVESWMRASSLETTTATAPNLKIVYEMLSVGGSKREEFDSWQSA